MQDLAGRLASRVQLTSDGLSAYLSAVEDAFGADIDYAMLVKHYGDAPGGPAAVQPRRLHRSDAEARYRRPRTSRTSAPATSSARI